MIPNQNEQNPNKLGYYLKVSLSLHLGFFLFALLYSFWNPGTPVLIQPTVQLDLVALPDQLKNQETKTVDITLPVKDAPPPKQEVAESEPDEKEMEAPEKREKEVQKEAQSVLERIRKAAAKKPEPPKPKRNTVDNKDLKKREEDLKRFEEAYRSALKGNQINQGTSATGALEQTINAYAGHITDRLRNNWSLPVWLQDQGLRAVVRIYIDGKGNLVRYQFMQSSNNDAFDDNVKSAINRSAPFAPPPEELARPLRNSGMEVLFPL
ncbi:MAG: TonB family protein [Oligoflexia bacterium]|nr:TonB family protein [Oligoflexia bacterium]